MKLKKAASAIAITFFVMAATACSTNMVNQSAGGVAGSTAGNTPTSQVAGGGLATGIGRKVLGFALGYGVSQAIRKAID